MIEIKLQWKYLKHDIDQWTWRLADTRIKDAEQKNSAQSSDDESDKTFFLRKIAEAVSVVKTKLSRIVVNSVEDKNDALDKEKDKWTICLEKNSMNLIDTESLTELIHQYIVRQSVYWWAISYAPDSVHSLSVECNELISNIVNTAFKTNAPVKKRKRPLENDIEIYVEP